MKMKECKQSSTYSRSNSSRLIGNFCWCIQIGYYNFGGSYVRLHLEFVVLEDSTNKHLVVHVLYHWGGSWLHNPFWANIPTTITSNPYSTNDCY